MKFTQTDQSLPVLYSFRRCPYAMRARLALYYSGQCVALREVVLKHKPPQLLSVSKKATVPVLVVENVVIDESLEIMQWALDQGDKDGWLNGVDGSVLTHSLIEVHDRDFKPKLDQYKYFDRHPELSQEEHLQRALPFLQQLNQRIKLHNGFLALNAFSALDAAIFPFIRQFAHCDLPRFAQLPLPHLQRWLNQCLCSGLFSQVMKKYQPWTDHENNAVRFGGAMSSDNTEATE